MMDTACLRIKFTPFLQDAQKGSDYCLEIVPEVTYLQNLDKIKWKNEENYIEYRVPVTYKITLLRKDNNKNKESLKRSYYSCVDLLLHTADEDLMRLDSGDIKRILSDTFILNNLTQEIKNCSSITLKNPLSDSKPAYRKLAEVQTDVNDVCSSQKVTIVKSLECPFKVKKVAVVQTEQKDLQIEIDVNQILDVDKICCANTEDQMLIGSLPNEKVLKLDQLHFKSHSPFKKVNDNKIDDKHRLSWTPICSMNTEDNNITSYQKMVALSPILDQEKYTIREEIRIDKDNYFKSLLKNEYFVYYDIFNLFKPVQQIEYMPHRVPPEERVAKIVQRMQREMKPLQIILSDIITKCSTLDFFKKKFQNLNRMPGISKQMATKLIILPEKKKCNRVVSSIVFEA